MDLFNRKRVEKLEQQIELLKKDLEKEKNNNKTLEEVLKSSKCSTLVLEENKKLIDWIEKILMEYSIAEVPNRERITIPIYKSTCRPCNFDKLSNIERKTIVIPEIIIEKQIEV